MRNCGAARKPEKVILRCGAAADPDLDTLRTFGAVAEAPGIALFGLVIVTIAMQWPTRRRVFGPVDDLCELR